jgi:hypothetical protein
LECSTTQIIRLKLSQIGVDPLTFSEAQHASQSAKFGSIVGLKHLNVTLTTQNL